MPISIELYHDYYTREKEDAHAINFSTTFEKINYFFDQFQCFCYFDRKSIMISIVHNLWAFLLQKKLVEYWIINNYEPIIAFDPFFINFLQLFFRRKSIWFSILHNRIFIFIANESKKPF